MKTASHVTGFAGVEGRHDLQENANHQEHHLHYGSFIVTNSVPPHSFSKYLLFNTATSTTPKRQSNVFRLTSRKYHIMYDHLVLTATYSACQVQNRVLSKESHS